MKKQMITHTIRTNTRVLSLFLSIIALLTCVSVTFAWFGSTFENLNTVITMGNYSANISVYSQKGDMLVSKKASNGENVSFDNSDSRSGWASGDVSCYYIYADNTGDINIKTYLSFASAFISTQSGNSNDLDSAKSHFSYFVKDVTNDSEASGGLTNMAKSEKLPTAEYIHSNGSTFASSDSVCAGTVNAGKNKVYALYFCCYDLPDALVSSDYGFVFNTSVITTQEGAPQGSFNTDDNAVQKAMIDALRSTTQNKSTQNKTTQSTTSATLPSTTVNSTQQSTTAQATTENEWEWEYNDSSKKTVCLTAYNGSKSEIIIPSAVDNAVITKLGDSLFENSSVKSVVVPACVTDFGADTFGKSTIKSLSFQTKTTVLGKVYSSEYASDSKAVYTADKTALVRYLPQNKSKSFTVAREVTTIYDNAFAGSSYLETLSMYNVGYVGTLTFANSSIKNFCLYGQNAVSAAGANVFGSKTSVTIHTLKSMESSYKTVSGVKGYKLKSDLKNNIYENALKTEIDGIKYVIIDNETSYEGVEYSMKGYAKIAVVCGYSKIQNDGVVIVPDVIVCDNTAYKVAAIGNNAFKNCRSLKHVVLANHGISYSSNSFDGCTNLELIQFNDVLPYAKSAKETAALPTEKSTVTTSADGTSTEPAE